MASWYGGNFHGRKTANGETYNMNEWTAAHKTLPFGTRVRVTNTRNGDTLIVRINDRGPFIAGRIIDLSRAAASRHRRHQHRRCTGQADHPRQGLSPRLFRIRSGGPAASPAAFSCGLTPPANAASNSAACRRAHASLRQKNRCAISTLPIVVKLRSEPWVDGRNHRMVLSAGLDGGTPRDPRQQRNWAMEFDTGRTSNKQTFPTFRELPCRSGERLPRGPQFALRAHWPWAGKPAYLTRHDYLPADKKGIDLCVHFLLCGRCCRRHVLVGRSRFGQVVVRRPEYVCGSAPSASPSKSASKTSYKKSKTSNSQASYDAPVKSKKKKSLRRNPYSNSGATYSGKASYYWQPQALASGGRFNPNAMTAAHKTLPFGTKVRVTNHNNGQSVVVTINDRGPYVAGRIIDLSKAAAHSINMQGSGVVPVTVAVLGKG